MTAGKRRPLSEGKKQSRRMLLPPLSKTSWDWEMENMKYRTSEDARAYISE